MRWATPLHILSLRAGAELLLSVVSVFFSCCLAWRIGSLFLRESKRSKANCLPALTNEPEAPDDRHLGQHVNWRNSA